MLKNNNLRINYLTKVLLSILGIGVVLTVVLRVFGINEDPIYPLKIPREFLNNNELTLGDDFSKVSHMGKLTQHYYYDGLSAEKKFTKGNYFNEMGDFYFDRSGKLERVHMSISNEDSLPWSEFLKKNLKIMISYYGKDCTIYRDKSVESVIYIEWKLNENNIIYMHADLKNGSSHLIDKDVIFLGFDYETDISTKFYTKNGTLESLGLY